MFLVDSDVAMSNNQRTNHTEKKKVYQQQNAVQNYGMTRKKNKLNQQKRKNQNKNFLKGTSLCEILFDTSMRITHQGHQLSICFRQLLIFFNADIFYVIIFFSLCG